MPFDHFLKITEIRQIQDLSIFWSLDGVFHETKSSSLVQKEDVMRFLAESPREIISVYFVCNGAFEVESNGRSETVLSVYEPSIMDVQERNRDAMEHDELKDSFAENDRKRGEALLMTRRVE